MSGRYLLDTNIIISLFDKDPQIHILIAEAEEVFVPCIAMGELYFGAYKSQNIRKNLARIDDFARNSTVLACNTNTAKIYGDIKNRLKEKGQPIPENDVWIAAVALEYALILVTKDSHFVIIDDLKVETW